MADSKRPRGRPKKDPSEVKRHNVTIAMADPIRQAIGEAAERNGRSISSEIDFRLGMSLALDEDTGSASVRRLIDFTRLAAAKIVEDAKRDWTEDDYLATELIGAFKRYVRANSPPSRSDAFATEIREAIGALKERLPEVGSKDFDPVPVAEVLQDFLDLYLVRRTLDHAIEEVEGRGAELTAELGNLFKIKNEPKPEAE